MPDYTNNFCAKWTDNNGNTFNVDLPVFWAPMGVISGLASGFCERKAVLNPIFVTGTTWTEATSAAITTRCAQGFALGLTGDALFSPSNNAAFYTAGSVTGANYMKAVDSAITTLVTGTTHFVTPEGTDYDTVNNTVFSGLAASAVARAAASPVTDNTSSAITQITSNGTDFAQVFNVAYPIEWAKQRKWMLDELRYTLNVGAATAVTSIYYDWKELSNYEYYNYTNTDLSPALSSAYINTINTGITSYGSGEASSYRYNYEGPNFAYTAVIVNDTHKLQSPDGANRVPFTLGFSESRVILKKDAAIVAYCAERGGLETIYRIWNEAGATKIGAGEATKTVAADGIYVLVDGASVALNYDNGNTDVTISALSISAGCTAFIPSNVHIEFLNVMDGGVFRPANATANAAAFDLNVNELFTNYRPVNSAGDLSPGIYVTGAVTGAADKSYMVNGGTLTIAARTNASGAIVSGAKNKRGVINMTGTGGSQFTSGVVVGPYGFLSANGGTTDVGAGNGIPSVAILSGGTASLTNIAIGTLLVFSGGSVDLTSCGVSYLGLTDGATINITGNSITPYNRLAYIDNIRIGTFQNFKFDVKPGWNTFKLITTSPAAGGVAYAISSTVDTIASASYRTNVATHVPKINGVYKSSPTDALPKQVSTFLPSLNSTTVWQNFSVIAINGGTAQSIPTNHYTGFRVRQWAADLTPTTPTTTT